MDINVTAIAEAVIALVFALVSTFVIPWIKGKFTTNQIHLFEDFVSLAVRAAEQIFASDEGYEKLEWVKEKIAEKGFKYDESTISTTIEAKVLDLHNELYGIEKWNIEE